MVRKLIRLVRYDWPLHFLLITLDLFPDNTPFLKLRGGLARYFFGECKQGLELGRCVSFYNPANIHLGANVYLAHGVRIMATDHVYLDDECVVGPYTVIVASNHTRLEGSFRFGEAEAKPICISKGCWLGAHVTVTAGSRIGQGAIIGAGAVTVGEIPENVLAVGVPAACKARQNTLMKPNLIFIGPMLGSKPNHTPDYGEILAKRLNQEGYTTIVSSKEEERTRRLVDMVGTLILRRKEYDICVLNMYSGLSFIGEDVCSYICKSIKKNLVMIMSGGRLPDFIEKHPVWGARVLNRANRIVSPSNFITEHLSRYGVTAHVIPNGYDIGSYIYRQRIKAKPNIVWLRAFHKVYNPIDAVRAVSMVRKQCTEVKLFMSGIDKRDGTLDEVKKEICQHKLEDRVELSLGVPKAIVPEFLTKGDIFLNTTSYESFGISPAEAAACGLCLITTNVGELPYLWKPDHSALLVNPNSPDEIARAILRIIDNPGLASQLSQNGRATAEQFDWSRVLPRWEDLFREFSWRHNSRSD